MNDMRIKTYIINLKESIERKRHMVQEVCKFPFMDVEWIDAINGARMTEEDIGRGFSVEKFTDRYHRPPAKGEIGCTLSHRKCYEHMVATDEPYALILEDDVSFICPEDAEHVIAQGIRLLKEGKADIVLFSSKVLLYNCPKKLDLKYVAYTVCNAYGTDSYLINLKACTYLIKKSRADIVADDYPVMRSMGLKIKSIYPNITIALSDNKTLCSLIEQEREKARYKSLKLTFKQRLKVYSEIRYCRLAVKCGWMIDRNFYN